MKKRMIGGKRVKKVAASKAEPPRVSNNPNNIDMIILR